MTTLNNLRQLLAEATPGPWRSSLFDGIDHEDGSSSYRCGIYPTTPGGPPILLTYGVDKRNARLIAAAPTHLADLITALEREAKVRELHAKGTFSFSWRDGLRFHPACPHCDGKAGIHECGCYADEDESDWKCQACGHESTYPCPTIRILDGNE